MGQHNFIFLIGQFLGPETDMFHQFVVPIFFSRIHANRKRKKQFEHALDYVTKIHLNGNELTLWARDIISLYQFLSLLFLSLVKIG